MISRSKCHIARECGRQSLFLLFWFVNLLWKKNVVDVGENTTRSNGHVAEELVEFLVVAHSKLKVTRDNTGLLVVTCSVSCKLKDFSAQVLHDGSKVHWCTTADALGITAFLQEAVDTTDRELQTSLGRARGALALLLAASSFSFSRHCC